MMRESEKEGNYQKKGKNGWSTRRKKKGKERGTDPMWGRKKQTEDSIGK